jgi:aminoglycoside 6'-N-acetyltransferase
MIVRHGNLVFRPATVEDIDLFEMQFGDIDGAGPHQWFGFTSFAAVRREVETRDLLGGDANMLVITKNDEVCGRVEWLARYWGRRDTSLCWEIAIGLLPQHRGHGIGTVSQRWLVDYLFSHTRVERIQATTDPTNTAEQKCLERAGFQVEGRIRRAQWRQGAWHDQCIYSILRDDWKRVA